jgi:DNA-binding transcriptional ArsR family regulator
MSPPAVSRHLRVLEGAGLVRRRVDGRIHWIALDPRPLDEARAWLTDAAGFWSGRLDALEIAVNADADADRLDERTA